MLSSISNKVLSGARINREDILGLFKSDDIFTIGELASHRAREINADNVFYIRNRHINPTNICVNRCKFCAFSRSKGDNGAYEFSIKEIIDKITHFNAHPYTEVHIVGGLHPDWPFEYYLDIITAIKENSPEIHIKAFTAVEVDYLSKISGLSLNETLDRLKQHGLDTMPGGGAEIFSPPIRQRLCPEKIDAHRWLEIHETAHTQGIRTNATMLYGHIETYEDRADHLLSLRTLQDKTRGFQAFIPLSYHPKNTDIGGSTPSGIDDLKTIAISRIALDNFDHIKAYWIMLGEKISQTAILFGADDLDGTIIEEKITHSAGGMAGEVMTGEQMKHLIMKAGKTPVERDSFYNHIQR